MAVVYEVFEIPLRKSSVISQEEMEGIFVNWQEILQCNHNFHADLIQRRSSGNEIIGDVICAHVCISFNIYYVDSCCCWVERIDRLTTFVQVAD